MFSKEDKKIVASIIYPLTVIMLFVFPVQTFIAATFYGLYMFGNDLANMFYGE